MSELLKKAAEYLAACENPMTFKNSVHYDVPTGWMNDPNGVIEAFGKYHVFYQHHPFAAEPREIFWGHTATSDFIHWESLPPVLAPDKPYDRSGCWSGSAIMHEGKLYLMYTGNSDGIQQQCLAYSEDGIHFEKYSGNPVIRSAQLPEGSDPYAFRDPCLIREGDGFLVLLGAKDTRNDCGRVLVYKSGDLIKWEYVGSLISRKEMVDPGIFECPSYAQFGEKSVLIASLNFMPTRGKLHRNFADTVGFVEEADLLAPDFFVETEQLLDYGFDFYAPQVLHAKDGRKILIGWMQMWEVTYPTQTYGWVGSLSIPRELTLRGNRLRMQPAREFNACCREFSRGILEGGNCSKEIPLRGACRIRMEIDGITGRGGLRLVGREGELSCRYDSKVKEIIMQREGSFVPKSETSLEENVWERIYPCEACGRICLDVWIDTSSAEVFVNDGEAVLTSTFFLTDTKIEILENETVIEYFAYSVESDRETE